MSRLVASEHGLRALIALSQRPDGLRPAEVAAILEIPFSSAERALRVLDDDRLVEHQDRRVALAADPRTGAAVLSDLHALRGELRVEVLDKSTLRGRLLDDRTPRDRALHMRVLAGFVDRSFPDRTQHGNEDAPPLRRLHDGVAVPSARRLHALARRHGLRRVVAFGSATRTDFRPDSDLDLLVEPIPGQRLGLRQRAALVADAETLFARDVDLVASDEVRPALAARIARDGVVLHGPAA